MFYIVNCRGILKECVKSRGSWKDEKKTMMYVVKKSSVGAVNQAQEGPSKPVHLVSLELLDESGKAVVNEAGKNVARDEIAEVGT